MDLNPLFEMEPEDYPEVGALLAEIKNWDRVTNAESYGAGAYAILYKNIMTSFYKTNIEFGHVFTHEDLFEALKVTKAYMKTHFDSERVRLGEYQKLVRGEKELPAFGLPDVVTAMAGNTYKEGKIKIVHGESYIGLVRFTPTKTYYESVISYGSSNRPESPHYSDQMELFLDFKTKTMSFDRAEVLGSALSRYAPK
jgi:acyl-homoserine-lactone acylase